MDCSISSSPACTTNTLAVLTVASSSSSAHHTTSSPQPRAKKPYQLNLEFKVAFKNRMIEQFTLDSSLQTDTFTDDIINFLAEAQDLQNLESLCRPPYYYFTKEILPKLTLHSIDQSSIDDNIKALTSIFVSLLHEHYPNEKTSSVIDQLAQDGGKLTETLDYIAKKDANSAQRFVCFLCLFIVAIIIVFILLLTLT